MADKHNANIPAIGNTIAADIPDIKENLEYHKDVFENFCKNWSNTSATDIFPYKMQDAAKAKVVQCSSGGTSVTGALSVTTTGSTLEDVVEHIRRQAIIFG